MTRACARARRQMKAFSAHQRLSVLGRDDRERDRDREVRCE
jgi:hypothetical protein